MQGNNFCNQLNYYYLILEVIDFFFENLKQYLFSRNLKCPLFNMELIENKMYMKLKSNDVLILWLTVDCYDMRIEIAQYGCAAND